MCEKRREASILDKAEVVDDNGAKFTKKYLKEDAKLPELRDIIHLSYMPKEDFDFEKDIPGGFKKFYEEAPKDYDHLHPFSHHKPGKRPRSESQSSGSSNNGSAAETNYEDPPKKRKLAEVNKIKQLTELDFDEVSHETIRKFISHCPSTVPANAIARKIIGSLEWGEVILSSLFNNRHKYMKPIFDQIQDQYGLSVVTDLEAICASAHAKNINEKKKAPQAFIQKFKLYGYTNIDIQKAYNLQMYLISGGTTVLDISSVSDLFVKDLGPISKLHDLKEFLRLIDFFQEQKSYAEFSNNINKSINGDNAKSYAAVFEALDDIFSEEVINSLPDAEKFLDRLSHRIAALPKFVKSADRKKGDPKGKGKGEKGKFGGKNNHLQWNPPPQWNPNPPQWPGPPQDKGKGKGKKGGKGTLTGIDVKDKNTNVWYRVPLPRQHCWDFTLRGCNTPNCIKGPHITKRQVAERFMLEECQVAYDPSIHEIA